MLSIYIQSELRLLILYIFLTENHFCDIFVIWRHKGQTVTTWKRLFIEWDQIKINDFFFSSDRHTNMVLHILFRHCSFWNYYTIKDSMPVRNSSHLNYKSCMQSIQKTKTHILLAKINVPQNQSSSPPISGISSLKKQYLFVACVLQYICKHRGK